MTSPIRFMYNNFAAASVTTVTASSEMPGFEASKIFDSFRFTGWKPTGAFEVTASNKTIYINDGSDKTVTLTEAIYTTGAALAAHIQTRLNASSTNWTCTYSTTTYKFTIGRSSGTALLRLSQTTDAAWQMIGYIGAIDDDVGTGKVADVARIHTSEHLTFDLSEAREVTAFIVIGPANDDFSIPSTATVRLKANNVNSFSSPPLSIDLTPDEFGIFKFLDDVNDTTYRYWRFEFEDKANPSGPSSFDLRVAYLGDHETLTERNISNGFKAVRVDSSIREESSSGVPFFRLRSKYWMIEGVVEWADLTNRSVISDLFNQVGNTVPFFVSVDPDAVVSESVSEFTKYVTFDSSFQNDHLLYKSYSVPLSFREVIG